jgi:hypothetical protein
MAKTRAEQTEAPTPDQVRRVVATAGRRAYAATCLSRADAEDISR